MNNWCQRLAVNTELPEFISHRKGKVVFIRACVLHASKWLVKIIAKNVAVSKEKFSAIEGESTHETGIEGASLR
jgi:hypothetical protein